MKHGARRRGEVNRNSVEGFFSIFKCDIKDNYQHVLKTTFTFTWLYGDEARANRPLKRVVKATNL